MKVVVLGAGVVGTACAWYLSQDGHEVTLIDRRLEAGRETSFANGGQISAGHAVTWAGRAVPGIVWRGLGQPDSPFKLKLQPSLRQWGWGLRFLMNCREEKYRESSRNMIRLALYSRGLLKALRAETGLEYAQETRGILTVFRDDQSWIHARGELDWLARQGAPQNALDTKACLDLEPALAGSAATLKGGVHSPEDESGDARLFTQNLCALAQRKGGLRFLSDTEIVALEVDGDRVSRIVTANGRIAADAVVVAMGSFSPFLVAPLGLKLPVYPLKGYSVTLEVGPDHQAPRVSITDEQFRIVISRYGNRVRAAGTAEIGGYDPSVDLVRAEAVKRSLLALFPRAGDPDSARLWAGLRPMTVDGPPIIGRTRFRNLFLDTGHGTYGWTMACGSGRAVADLVAGKTPAVDLSGLTLDRFG